jgi:SAM-dependent methyltransferase
MNGGKMPTLAELAPAERARLLGKPEGELGIAIAGVMNETNARIIDTVYHRLGLNASYRVLELGFGNGRTVPLLMQLADGITYAGIEISETMVAEASAYNRGLVAAGRASFHLASAEAVPYPERSFDRALAVNVVYFWPDPVRALAEIRRVLKPDGFSVIAGIDSTTAAALPFYRAEYGFRVHDAEALIAFHQEAGFKGVTVEPFDEVTKLRDGTLMPRHYHLVVSRP